ncbi:MULTISPECIES: tryptophan halogenase family protein [unclassified Pseudoalteromonas]|uniref:tryptophan halogenase family protein n=1 Tax=unclassified Pseudoalteromonas TaxID=194690 RepID=UPI001601C88C|nr:MULTISPECIES: tryptophan halogenase family protein [unclassified Pseudoalteromonas]MBB1335562.1 tryptophan 7-halogenase [Pseudoalteromonas sp. SR41-6]MBB1461103.1 tryptophan 7-halogenase [Pseudoalteromonas sp. SG41-8]MBB1471071.1 tryptophan 7-halogenase [Pseudoalteromonas sp. SG41-5]
MNIIIVGGGTAGWMAANLLNHSLTNTHVTLIESPTIAPIGVGEGSTAQLKQFFDTLNISESEWMPQCNATYKLGIEFKNWSTHPGHEQYFHSFYGQTDLHTQQQFIKSCLLKRQGVAIDAHPDSYFLAAYLAKQRRGPHTQADFPFQQSYGYHFDSGLLGLFLANRATSKGVKHLKSTIAQVELDSAGNIKQLVLDENSDGQQCIAADFFIDCSGFKGLLIQQALAVPWLSFKENLFNDSAIVLPTMSNQLQAPQTTSTALKYGWQWAIPLTNRIGNGYVYSQDFCSADEAETELRTKLGLLNCDVPARKLTMKVGRVKQHWYKNCLAVGLSQGFIEPLEATALHLVQQTIESFIACFEHNRPSEVKRDPFNMQINNRIEGIRDYIVCHYRASNRRDTEYWQANGQNEMLSASLKNILQCWLSRNDLTGEIAHQGIENYYSSLSWHTLLSGYGVFPPSVAKPSYTQQQQIKELYNFNHQCASHFRALTPIIPQQK